MLFQAFAVSTAIMYCKIVYLRFYSLPLHNASTVSYPEDVPSREFLIGQITSHNLAGKTSQT